MKYGEGVGRGVELMMEIRERLRLGAYAENKNRRRRIYPPRPERHKV